MTKISAAIAATAVLIVLAIAFYFAFPGAPDDKYAQCRANKVAGGSAAIGGPFTLVDEAGQTVTDLDVIKGPSLLYFGYTFCPDICPLDVARNAETVTILDERGYDVTPIFISVDSKRDTPEVMAEFTDYMHPRMLGLTGSPEQIKAASTAYRTYYNIRDAEDEYYLIDHSTFSYLVFPEVGFVEYFQRELTPEQTAERVACFVDAQ